MSHKPLTINKFKTGLVQNQPNQILTNDAFPILFNAMCFRNTIQRRLSWLDIGRLRRVFDAVTSGTSGILPWSFNLYSQMSPPVTPEATAMVQLGSVIIVVGAFTFKDVNSDGMILETAGTGYVTTITNVSNAANAVISITDPDYVIGEQVYISGVSGILDVNGNSLINNKYFTITNVNAGVSITINLDTSAATLYSSGGKALRVSGSMNYLTGDVTLTNTSPSGQAVTLSFNYFPGLPVMAIFDRNTASGSIDNVYFDTTYAYKNAGGDFFELQPGTTWDMGNFNFPSCANYFQDKNNQPVFWVTSDTGTSGNPIRYTNGLSSSNWIDFSPIVSPNADPAKVIRLWQCKFLIPFRQRLFAFNLYRGNTLATSTHESNGILCSALGTPFSETSSIVTDVNADAWNDSKPGSAFLDFLPTTEPIVGVWPVMNQIIIKTTTKTWVLSDTGSRLAPFRFDLLDESNGTNSGFGSVNMGGFITGIGDRFAANSSPTAVIPIDQKILDLVYNLNQGNHGLARVYGIRDFSLRFNSYIYSYQPGDVITVTFPNRRLIYNYDNESWAIYEDSLTALGYFRTRLAITWAQANFTWAQAQDTWQQNSTAQVPTAGGNQQGFVGLLDSAEEEGESLAISGIASNGVNAATFTVTDYNLLGGTIIKIQGIVGDYASLNGTVGQIQPIDENTFYMYSYDAARDLFRIPVAVGAGTYIGGGAVRVRRNFDIVSKAFNMLDDGQSMHISYIDTLVEVSQGVTVQMGVLFSLNDSNPVNIKPENPLALSLFSKAVSLSNPTEYPLENINNRTIVNQRGNMLSLEFSLDNATMAGDNFNTKFVLTSLTLWQRPAGRPLMPLGGG